MRRDLNLSAAQRVASTADLQTTKGSFVKSMKREFCYRSHLAQRKSFATRSGSRAPVSPATSTQGLLLAKGPSSYKYDVGLCQGSSPACPLVALEGKRAPGSPVAGCGRRLNLTGCQKLPWGQAWASFFFSAATLCRSDRRLFD